MLIFLKANTAALIATLCDYAVTIALVYFSGMHPVAAAVAGTVSGGIINFLMGRYWAFNETKTGTTRQAYKYFLVWTGNLLLNACGMYLLTIYADIHFAAAKLGTALIVAVAYNYPLQKNYVFRKN
jgi:putative flippase GtrA